MSTNHQSLVMEADRWTQVERLFGSAREVPPDERVEWLQEHCDEPAMREEVVSLLSAREQAPEFFEAAAREVVSPMLDEFGDGGESLDGTLDLAGQTIGGYRLVEEIGIGGMSVVYRAERVEADFEQTVAVKLLQRCLHVTDAADRFRAERQMLASIDHPSIAQLIDGGVTEGGRPYLVMEYVDGVPITTYAEEKGLDLPARLDLLGQVLDAVEAAHRQLVVHRDLKPSNVLVTETDDGPRVRLLDFGIAKLLDDSMPVTRPQTRTGQQLMTPAYAAPEQVAGDEITTATDVYQVGVLAYELLAATRPFDLTGKSLTEVERILLEDEPEKPSERAETKDAQLRGDLDTIVLKTLRKEPERRYRSVEALAADLERYQQGEPVEARPATLGYRAKKFVQRNRTVVGAAVLIFLLAIVYAVTVTMQANRLAEQRDRAQREAETTEEVKAYLVDLFRTGNPMESSAEDLSAETLLRRGIERADQLDDRPLVQAELLSSLGNAAGGFGQWNRANSLLRRSLALRRKHLDAPHPDLAATLYRIGDLLRKETDYGRALTFYDKALAMSRQLEDTTHRYEVLTGFAKSLAETGARDSAATLFERGMEIRRRTSEADSSANPSVKTRYARFLQDAGRYEEAKRTYKTALQSIKADTNAYPVGRRAVGPIATLLIS